MPSNPDKCECQSQLFTMIWAVTSKEAESVIDPKAGTTNKRPVGFKCIECDAVQLTREIPEDHAADSFLSYPEEADRDMVRE